MHTQQVSYRSVLYLAVPIILAGLTQPLMSAVDTAIAGHLPGPQFLAGVAVGSLLFNLIFWAFGFLRMGTTGVVAQYFGAGQAMPALLTVCRGILIALLLGCFILIAQVPLIQAGLALLGASAEAAEQARLYAYGRVWSAPLVLINYVILGWLLGCQRVKAALLIQLLINLVNFLAVMALVYGWDWGVRGIGAATAIADLSGASVGAILLWRQYQQQIRQIQWSAVFETTELCRQIQINSHIFIRTACLLATMSWFTHLGAQQGDVLLATNAILLNFLSFTSYGLDGFAHAAETLSGAAVGQKKSRQLQRVVRICLVWGLLGASLYTLVYGLFGGNLVRLLTDQMQIATSADQYLLWLVLAPLVSMPAYLYDGVFMGATRTYALMLIMLGCAVSFFCLSWFMLPWLGNHGLWIAFLLFNAARGLGLAIAFKPIVLRPIMQRQSAVLR